MKTFLFLLVFNIPLLLSSQNQSDTLNQIDENGQKQGYWIVKGKDRPEKGFCDTCILEKGRYVNNRKEGAWIFYKSDGTIRSSAEFKYGRPKGTFTREYIPLNESEINDDTSKIHNIKSYYFPYHKFREPSIYVYKNLMTKEKK